MSSQSSALLTPAMPLSEIEHPIVLRAEPAPAAFDRGAHPAGAEIVTASTSIRLAIQQFTRAQTRGQWSPETAHLAEDIVANLGLIHGSLATLAHLAATSEGGPL